MAVSDESGGGLKPIRRKWQQLPDEVWARIRVHYETSDLGQRAIAKEYDLPVSTVTKRCAAEKWRKRPKVTQVIQTELERSAIAEVRSVIAQETRKLGEQVRADIAPWLEKQRTRQVKRAIVRSTRAQKRLDKIADGYKVADPKTGEVIELVPTPKDEAMFASAEEKYDAIIRRNLGMSDGVGVGGSLNVNILTGQAAVQIAPNKSA